jgi:hypothetical protein
MLSPENRTISFAIWTIWIGFGFTYYGIILLISRIYSMNENNDNDSNDNDDTATCSFEYLPIFVSSISEFIGIALGTCVIDRLGRVNSQFIFYSVTGISVLICAFDLSRYTLLIFTCISFYYDYNYVLCFMFYAYFLLLL